MRFGYVSTLLVLYTASAHGKLDISPVDFWSQPVHGAVTARMPARLRSRALSSPTDRAEQLQWALVAANEASDPEVTLIVPPGEYDFSTIGTHPSTVAGVPSALLPKLVVGRNGLTIAAADPADKPHLLSRGAGRDGAGHGRVFLFVPSGMARIRVSGLHFQGDADLVGYQDPNAYAHENNDALREAMGGTASFGLMMIGYGHGANDIVVESCEFEAISIAGLKVVGNATVKNSTFKGIIPAPDSETWERGLHGIQKLLAERIGKIGYNINVGVLQADDRGSVTITGSSFEDLVQGISGGSMNSPWKISRNTFTGMADHAIYILSRVRGEISDNIITRVYHAGIKLGYYAPPDSDPVTFADQPRNLVIGRNQFSLMREQSILLAGSFNYIHDNRVQVYRRADDSTPGGYYDPAFVNAASTRVPNIHPPIVITTIGGQGGWFAHSVFNRIENNTASEGKLPIFLWQHVPYANAPAASQDRSVAFNAARGPGQRIYFATRKTSTFPPILVAEYGTEVVFGPPPNYADAKPSDGGYRAAATLDWAKPLSRRFGSERYLLVKYTGAPDIFLIGERGRHERVSAEGRAFEVLAIADLDGDGNDEVYSREIGTTFIFGSMAVSAEGRGVSLAQWHFYSGGQALTAWAVWNRQLVTAYSNATTIYGSSIAPGDTVHRCRGAVHAAGQKILMMAATDLTGDGTEEIYALLEDRTIRAVYPGGSTDVYRGAQLLVRMTPARGRMLQLFSGTTIYETSPSRTIPSFGGGESFYRGPHRSTGLLAADLDGDGRQEVYATFAETTTITGFDTTSFTFYEGTTPLRSMERYYSSTERRDRIVSVFEGSSTIYESEGFSNNGRSWFRRVFDEVRAATGGT